MFQEDINKLIISTWMHGEHLEDAELIPLGEFEEPYKSMAGMIRTDGFNAANFIRRFGAKKTADVLGSYYPALYQSSMQSILTQEMMTKLPVNPTPEELMKHADKYHRYWYERPKPSDLTGSYVDAVKERQKESKLETGIGIVDELTYGLHKGQLIIIGARPSVGKSAFSLQVAFDIAYNGDKVLFFPLEMSAEETMDRIVMRFSNVSPEALRSGVIDDAQEESIQKVIELIDGLGDNFQVYENVRELDSIRSIIQEEHPTLVVIDQLSQIRNGDDYRTIREKYVEITRTLKAICLQENVAIMLPCQMNRESSKTDIVTVDNLKESGSIEEDADVVVILSNAKDENGTPKMHKGGKFVRVEVAKNRQGACGSREMMYIGKRFSFLSIPEGYTHSEEDVPF